MTKSFEVKLGVSKNDPLLSRFLNLGANPVVNLGDEAVERFLERLISIMLMQCGLGLIDTIPLSSPSVPPDPLFGASRPR